jgi:hypothetical protein
MSDMSSDWSLSDLMFSDSFLFNDFRLSMNFNWNFLNDFRSSGLDDGGSDFGDFRDSVFN